ncbi:MAG: hypothetical protein GX811_08275 [Lentisphaerae bacterium]|nr:hypothetical protein [Lentisphaerota bacterium]
MRLKSSLTSALTLILLAIQTQTFAANWHVKVSGNDTNDGSSWETAKATIQAAVDVAQVGDTILLTNDTYYLTSEIVITKPITIRSAFNSQANIDADYNSRCFRVNTGTTEAPVLFERIQIAYGVTDGPGGGIYAEPGSLVFAHFCTIVANTTTGEGGGAYNIYATACSIVGNNASRGGGVAYSIVDSSHVTNNEASEYGGGSYESELNNCLVWYNKATTSGGGTYKGKAINCTILQNKTINGFGGGVSYSTVHNSIVYYNDATNEKNIYSANDIKHSCSSYLPLVNGNTREEPLIVNISNHDFTLAAESPCIDAGNNSLAVTNFPWDATGNIRIWNETIDMGAYEYGSIIPAPENLVATKGDFPDKIILTWDPIPSAGRYDVFYATTNNIEKATLHAFPVYPTYVFNNPSANRIYYFWVRARNFQTLRSEFTSGDFGYGRVTVPSQPPTGLTASDGTYPDKIRLTWDESIWADSYEIWRNTINNPDTATKVTETAISTFDDMEAIRDTTYFYWIKAVNINGASDFSSPATGSAKLNVPASPDGVSASEGSYEDKIRVTWNKVTGATSYEVWRHTTNNSQSATKIAETASLTYDDTAIVAGTLYFYWIKAVNSSGASPFSAHDTGYVKMPPTADSDSVPVFRFYSFGAPESTYTHLWTINETERDVLMTWPSWTYEGIAWRAHTEEKDNTTPLYRLYEPNIRRHLYTVNTTEYSALEATSWQGEDVQYYVYPDDSVTGTIPAYRFYHSVNQNHHFTIDENEKDTIIATPEWGYTYEGIAFYVFEQPMVGKPR